MSMCWRDFLELHKVINYIPCSKGRYVLDSIIVPSYVESQFDEEQTLLEATATINTSISGHAIEEEIVANLTSVFLLLLLAAAILCQILQILHHLTRNVSHNSSHSS